MKSIENRVGQMLMAGFNGYTAPDYFLEWLRDGKLGGVILFARNVQSPEQLAALTQQLHDAAKYPLLIAIDQEGGTVARLRDDFTESPGAMALSSNPNDAEAATEAVSRVLAEEMIALGINWTYAPAVDVTYNADNPTVGTRSFGSNHDRVAALASAAVRGFQSGGVAACAKHFPGLGNTAIDTHIALPRLETDPEHLLAHDLLPYRVAIENGLATIMTTHTIFTAMDAQYPATLSEHIVGRLIREESGFNGVVTTDCMEMKAIDDNYAIADSVVRAANAGIDIILFSHTREKQAEAYDQLLAAVKRGDVSETTVDAANARIKALKARFPVTRIDTSSIKSQEHLAVVNQAAREGMSLLRAEEGVLPLLPDDARKIVLIEFAPSADSLVQESKTESRLASFIKQSLPNISSTILTGYADSAAFAMNIAKEADVVILATRNAHLNPALKQAVQALDGIAAKTILLALRNPYDAALVTGGTVICTVGDSTPTLQAVGDALTGVFTPSGKLPVEVW